MWEIRAYLFRPEKLECRWRDKVELCIYGQRCFLLFFVLHQRDRPVLGSARVATKESAFQSNATRARRLENRTPDREVDGKLLRLVCRIW